MQLLAKTMCGDEIACELITILSTELGIPGVKLLATIRDRASTNNVATVGIIKKCPYRLHFIFIER